jgi:hypothetical protein
MEILTAKKFKEERCIAYGVIEKIKAAAFVLESDDPTHKNGFKFRINKEEYHRIINREFNNKCARHMNQELMKTFINLKLRKL